MSQNVAITQESIVPGAIKQRHLVASPTRIGDLYYGKDGNSFTNLGIGTEGQVLTVSSGVPSWQTVSYGHMYIYNLGTGSTTVTVSAVDTYYQIPSGVTGGVTNGFTFQNARELKNTYAADYLVDWSLNVQCSVATQTLEGTVMVNGVANTTISGHSNVSTSTQPVVMTGNGILTLAVGDLVSMAVLNHSATNNITINHLTLTISRIL
jgi:hypothetical protein